MYCNLCEEVKTDHPSICTTCGENLQPQPQPQQQSTPSRSSQQQSPNINSLTTILNNNLTPNNEIWEQPPAEALDPTNAPSNKRATSEKFINHIPRINIDKKSFLLYNAIVEISIEEGTGTTMMNNTMHSSNFVFHATIGELSNSITPPYKINGVVKTVKTMQIQSLTEEKGEDVIAYFTRGGGVTFASMMEQAKQMGAIGIIVGNNNTVWPYIMKGSTNTKLPAVMIKRSDGKLLHSKLHQTPKACITVTKSKNSECVICKDDFKIGDKVIRLPFCFHYFHEECALYWLRKNNTCPCCRKELPTDDEEYELERRGRSGRSGDSGDNWDSMFG